MVVGILGTLLLTGVIASAGQIGVPSFVNRARVLSLNDYLEQSKSDISDKKEQEEMEQRERERIALIRAGKPVPSHDGVLEVGKHARDYLKRLLPLEVVQKKVSIEYQPPSYLPEGSRVLGATLSGLVQGLPGFYTASGIEVYYETSYGDLSISQDYIDENGTAMTPEETINASVKGKKAKLITYKGGPSGELRRELSWFESDWDILIAGFGDYPKDELQKIAESLPEPKLKQ